MRISARPSCDGASERLAPILMTALAAGLALVPIALGMGKPGSEIQAPMAIVIFCGLADVDGAEHGGRAGGLLSGTAVRGADVPGLWRNRGFVALFSAQAISLAGMRRHHPWRSRCSCTAWPAHGKPLRSWGRR